jgi:hypothetical protein
LLPSFPVRSVIVKQPRNAACIVSGASAADYVKAAHDDVRVLDCHKISVAIVIVTALAADEFTGRQPCAALDA